MSAENSHPAPTVLRVQRASTVDLIATELRNAVFSGALAVGRPLGEIDIAKQLGVSRGPLREATQRLVQEGILVSIPGRGMRVGQIARDELRDLFDARLAVEVRSALSVIRHGGESVMTALQAAYDRLADASHGTDARAIGDADLDFHWAIVDAGGNARLLRYMSTLIVETRMASYSMSGDYVVRRDICPSHESILRAIRDRDEDTTRKALQEHMSDAVARLSGDVSAVRGVEVLEQPVAELGPHLEPISRPG